MAAERERQRECQGAESSGKVGRGSHRRRLVEASSLADHRDDGNPPRSLTRQRRQEMRYRLYCGLRRRLQQEMRSFDPHADEVRTLRPRCSAPHRAESRDRPWPAGTARDRRERAVRGASPRRALRASARAVRVPAPGAALRRASPTSAASPAAKQQRVGQSPRHAVHRQPVRQRREPGAATAADSRRTKHSGRARAAAPRHAPPARYRGGRRRIRQAPRCRDRYAPARRVPHTGRRNRADGQRDSAGSRPVRVT